MVEAGEGLISKRELGVRLRSSQLTGDLRLPHSRHPTRRSNTLRRMARPRMGRSGDDSLAVLKRG